MIERDTDGLEFPFWLLPLALAPVALSRRGAAQAQSEATPGPVTTAAPPAMTLPAPVPDVLPVTGPVSEPVTPGPQREAMPASTEPEVRAAVSAAMAPARAKISEAQTQATFDIHNVLKNQASEIRKQVSAPLIRAGVHPAVVEQRVQTALAPMAAAQKAIETVSKTGTVTAPAREALLRAQAVYPDLKKKLTEAAAPVRQARIEAERGAQRVRRVVERAAQAAPAPIRREAQRAVTRAAAPARREAQRAVTQATAPVKREVDALTQGIPGPLKDAAKTAADSMLKGRLDPDAMRKLGEAESKKLLSNYASKYGKDALQKFAPPGIKIPGGIDVGGAVDMLVSGKVTAEGVKELVYDSTKGSAETFIQGATGLPITLPKDFTLKSIAGTLTSIIPTDLQGVLDKGLLVASQAVSGAVTAALAGSAIGSVVPGLGTVVGIGVALGVNALKGALKEKPPPYARRCPTKVTCPKVPNLSPLELLPWLATEQVAVYQTVAKDRQKSYCGAGASVECTYRMLMLTERVAEILNPSGVKANMLTVGKAADVTKSAAYTLGLPQLRKLLPLYERAPKTRSWFSEKTKTLTQEPNRELARVLAQLKDRKRLLDAFVARKNSIPRMTSQEAETFRYDVWTVLQNAIYQAALAPGRETRDWLKTVGEMWVLLVKREGELRAGSQKRIAAAQAKRAELAKRPGWKPKQYTVT